MRSNPIRQVLYLRPDNRRTAPAFVLCDNGELTLLYVWCRSEVRPDFIIIAHDDDCDGIYEDAQANWFSVSPEETLKIAANLKSVGSRLK